MPHIPFNLPDLYFQSNESSNEISKSPSAVAILAKGKCYGTFLGTTTNFTIQSEVQLKQASDMDQQYIGLAGWPHNGDTDTHHGLRASSYRVVSAYDVTVCFSLSAVIDRILCYLLHEWFAFCTAVPWPLIMNDVCWFIWILDISTWCCSWCWSCLFHFPYAGLGAGFWCSVDLLFTVTQTVAEVYVLVACLADFLVIVLRFFMISVPTVTQVLSLRWIPSCAFIFLSDSWSAWWLIAVLSFLYKCCWCQPWSSIGCRPMHLVILLTPLRLRVWMCLLAGFGFDFTDFFSQVIYCL